MPYHYKGAIGRLKSLDALWAPVDLSATDVNQILATYSKVYLTLGHSAFPQDVYLDLGIARSSIGVYLGSKTIPQWLASLGNASLPTMASLPSVLPKRVLYADAFRAGFHVNPVDRTRHQDAQLPPEDKDDLLLTKAGLDFRNWGRYCMVTVNGFFHRCVGALEGLYVVDGARSGRIGNDTQVGVHSFKDVGPLDVIPITPSMLYKPVPGQAYAQCAHVKLPYNVEGKVVLLVLGGYLQVLDQTYSVATAQSLRINLNRLALPERLFESRGQLDLSSLALETSPNNPSLTGVEQLYSDAVLQAYLCLSQSFVVVIDAPELFVRRLLVEKTGLPGRFLTPTQDFKNMPLLSQYGRVLDYRSFPQDGQMVLATSPAREVRYTFTTAPWSDENAIDSSEYMARPWRHGAAYQLDFGRFG